MGAAMRSKKTMNEQTGTDEAKQETTSIGSNKPAFQDAYIPTCHNKAPVARESEMDEHRVSLLKTDSIELTPNRPDKYLNTSLTNEQIMLTEACAFLENHKPQQSKDARIPNDDHFEMYKRVMKMSKTNEHFILTEVCAYFENHEPQQGKDAIIPYDDYMNIYSRAKTALHNQEETNETNQEKSPVGSNGEKNRPTIQMLNTCNTKAGQLFQDILRQKLEDMVIVKELTRVADVEESDQRNVLIVIGNIDENSSAQETVNKCLEYVKEDRYGRLIVIVMHVKRESKLPRTDIRAQLKSTEYSQVGKILDMGYLLNEGIYSCSKNNTALKEIYEFLQSIASIHSEYQHKRPRIEETDSGHDINPKAKRSDSTDQKAEEENGQDAYLLTNPNRTPVAREFADKLKAMIEKQGVCLYKTDSVDANELDPDFPIFVVCNNNSRIEADLESCLHDISGKVYSRIVLVVLHVCRREKLPRTYTRQYLQTSSSDEKYEDIPKIVDIAYSKDDGIYPCKMNDDAFKELENFHAYQHTKQEQSHKNVKKRGRRLKQQPSENTDAADDVDPIVK